MSLNIHVLNTAMLNVDLRANSGTYKRPYSSAVERHGVWGSYVEKTIQANRLRSHIRARDESKLRGLIDNSTNSFVKGRSTGAQSTTVDWFSRRRRSKRRWIGTDAGLGARSKADEHTGRLPKLLWTLEAEIPTVLYRWNDIRPGSAENVFIVRNLLQCTRYISSVTVAICNTLAMLLAGTTTIDERPDVMLFLIGIRRQGKLSFSKT